MTSPTAAQRRSWDEHGYFILPGWSDPDLLEAMTGRIVDLARRIDGGEKRSDLLVSPEGLLGDAPTPEGRISKIFRVMRAEDVFREFATDPRLLAMLAELIGPDQRPDDMDADANRLLLREVFSAAGGTHDDLDEYDRAMAEEARIVVLVDPERILGNG